MSTTQSDSDVQARTQQPMLARHRQQNEDKSAEPPTAPTGGNQFARFPLSYRDGLSQWWAGLSPAVTEHKVLSFIPYVEQSVPTHAQTGRRPSNPNARPENVTKLPQNEAAPVITDSNTDPYGPRQWKSDLVQLEGKNRFLNEFSVERVGEQVKNDLVMLHGYGAGLGFFFGNFDALSRLSGWKLYALDMLGMGRSSRPAFKIRAKERQEQIKEAEAWFVDSLEEWRIKKGIDRFTLLGHSMGGYMAVAYALKYPGHLKKLILASPVGIPEDPYAVNASMPEPENSTLGNEFTQSGRESSSGSSTPATTDTKQEQPRRPMPKWLVTLWDANFSPFSIVRLAGPLGPRLVSGWTSRRFNHLEADQSKALHDYSYSLFRQPGSGEYALAYVLAPGAYARSPLIRRVQGVGRQWVTANNTDAAGQAVQRVREHGVPVVFMYGENDWMDVKGGHAATEKMRQEQKRILAEATPEEKAKENGDAKVVIIRKAGHHVYLDSPEHFNEVVTAEMKDVERREKRLGN